MDKRTRADVYSSEDTDVRGQPVQDMKRREEDALDSKRLRAFDRAYRRPNDRIHLEDSARSGRRGRRLSRSPREDLEKPSENTQAPQSAGADLENLLERRVRPDQEKNPVTSTGGRGQHRGGFSR